jgi:hypothetical protein
MATMTASGWVGLATRINTTRAPINRPWIQRPGPAAGIGAAGCERIAGEEHRAEGETAEQQMPVGRHGRGACFGGG